MFIALLFLFLKSAFADEVAVGIGTSIQIPIPATQSIHVSNGKVVKIMDLGRQVRITGKKPGMATVTTDSKTFFVSVLELPAWYAYERLRTALSEMRGLELEIEDGLPIVRGKLLRTNDWIKLSEAVGRGGRYIFAAEPDPLIHDELAQHFTKYISDNSLPQPDLELGPALVRLSAERKDLVKRFETLLQPYGFRIETGVGSLTLEPLVRVQILVTEIRKKVMRRLGISWPSTYQAQILPVLIPPGSAPNTVSVQLEALEESGLGRILASPNVLCRSGKEAQFLAGGEFPIKISSRKDASVVWKRYGVLLKIKPVADFGGRMSIGIETEVSTIDTSRTVDGIPGLLSNKIESHFDLKGSRTIALSGLIKQETGNSSNGLPGLGSIPILGSLFSSKEFRDEKTELVVFVTPEVVHEHGVN